MTSFFGGNPNVSHFTTSWHVSQEAYRLAQDACGKEYQKHGKSEHWRLLCQARDAEWEAIKTEKAWRSDRVKEVGFKTRYFQFRNGDEAGKAKAKRECERYAKEWSRKLGFDLAVCEGCFL